MVQTGMVIFMVSFFFSGTNAITSFYFTSIGKALESAVISMSRGLVVLLACIFVLPAWFGMMYCPDRNVIITKTTVPIANTIPFVRLRSLFASSYSCCSM